MTEIGQNVILISAVLPVLEKQKLAEKISDALTGAVSQCCTKSSSMLGDFVLGLAVI
jgi:hypothetical protein